MKDKWRQIERELKAQGWKIQKRDSRHFKCVPPDKSKDVVHVAPLGSSWRQEAFNNMLSDLRRSGYCPGLMRPVEVSQPPSSTRGISADDWRGAAMVLGELQPDLNLEPGIDDPNWLLGKHFRRTDRIDPRDPKTCVSMDWKGKSVVFRDRRGKQITRALGDLFRDIRLHKLEVFTTLEPAHALPSVKDEGFAEALRALRQASDLSTADVAGLLDNQDILQTKHVLAWEKGKLAPTRSEYDLLLVAFPALSDAFKPDPELPTSEVATDPETMSMPKQATKPSKAPSNGKAASAPAPDVHALLDDMARVLFPKEKEIKFTFWRKQGLWTIEVNREQSPAIPGLVGCSGDSFSAAAQTMLRQWDATLERRQTELQEQRARLDALFGRGSDGSA